VNAKYLKEVTEKRGPRCYFIIVQVTSCTSFGMFSIQSWRPHFEKNIDLIEGVQRRATIRVIQILKTEVMRIDYVF